MRASIAGAWTVGGGCAEVGNVLHRGGSGGASLQVRVAGRVPSYWEVSERISPSVDMATDGAYATSKL